MKKIHILYTINFLNKNGPSKVLMNLIETLNLEKYDITVLTIIDQNDPIIIQSLKDRGIHIIEFKFKKSIFSILKNWKKIVRTICNLNFDVIHTHGIVTSIIVSSNCIKSYKITTIHNNVYEDYFYTYGKLKGKIIAFFHLKFLKRFDQIICCSQTSYEIIKNKFDTISYIRNGINVAYLKDRDQIRKKIRKDLNIADDARVFIYAGVISNLKRVVDLVNVFSRNSKDNEFLLVLGDGPLLSDAKKVANTQVKFLGFQENVFDYLLASDVYLSYSSSEGFSISIIEALEANLLLLLSDIPSHKECFEIDSNYYLGEVFDLSNFSEKKESVLEKADSVSHIQTFKQKYLSAEAMTHEYEKYYERGIE